MKQAQPHYCGVLGEDRQSYWLTTLYLELYDQQDVSRIGANPKAGEPSLGLAAVFQSFTAARSG